jgi:hypothetical protein
MTTGDMYFTQQEFGKLHMVVRFEVDACLKAAKPSDVDGLRIALEHTSISQSSNSPSDQKVGIVPPLRVHRVGTLVPQEDIVELVTRSVRTVKLYKWREVLPQLYFSQTRHHILAIHNHGKFERLRRDELERSDTLRAHTAAMQPTFKKLQVLLKAIQSLAISHKLERLSLVQRDGRLEVMTRAGEDELLEAVIARFS